MFSSRAKAELWGRDIENALEQGRFLDTRAIDTQVLAEYIEKYIEHLTPQPGQMPDKIGWKQEVTRLKAWLNNPLTSRPISKVTYVDLIDHIRSRRRSHKKNQRPGAEPKYVSDQTIKHELAVLSNIYEFAKTFYQYEGLVNPVRAIPMRLKPGSSREIDVRILPETWERIEVLLKKQRNKMYVLASELAIETAMRKGELLRLKPSDIHTSPTLKMKYVTATDFRQIGGTVQAFFRNIPLTIRAEKIVSQVLELRSMMKNDPSPTIWGTISSDGLSRAFSHACQTLGIKDSTGCTATFHSTRHEACSRMSNAGIPINKLMKITGHKTMSQLQRYYNPTIDDLCDVINMLNPDAREEDNLLPQVLSL
jgi:integrase